ncbi:hypothetical protein MMPV_007084 [Pyropia vietnamensis]
MDAEREALSRLTVVQLKELLATAGWPSAAVTSAIARKPPRKEDIVDLAVRAGVRPPGAAMPAAMRRVLASPVARRGRGASTAGPTPGRVIRGAAGRPASPPGSRTRARRPVVSDASASGTDDSSSDGIDGNDGDKEGGGRVAAAKPPRLGARESVRGRGRSGRKRSLGRGRGAAVAARRGGDGTTTEEDDVRRADDVIPSVRPVGAGTAGRSGIQWGRGVGPPGATPARRGRRPLTTARVPVEVAEIAASTDDGGGLDGGVGDRSLPRRRGFRRGGADAGYGGGGGSDDEEGLAYASAGGDGTYPTMDAKVDADDGDWGPPLTDEDGGGHEGKVASTPAGEAVPSTLPSLSGWASTAAAARRGVSGSGVGRGVHHPSRQPDARGDEAPPPITQQGDGGRRHDSTGDGAAVGADVGGDGAVGGGAGGSASRLWAAAAAAAARLSPTARHRSGGAAEGTRASGGAGGGDGGGGGGDSSGRWWRWRSASGGMATCADGAADGAAPTSRKDTTASAVTEVASRRRSGMPPQPVVGAVVAAPAGSSSPPTGLAMTVAGALFSRPTALVGVVAAAAVVVAAANGWPSPPNVYCGLHAPIRTCLR